MQPSVLNAFVSLHALCSSIVPVVGRIDADTGCLQILKEIHGDFLAGVPGLVDDTHPVACKTVLSTVHGTGAYAGKTHAQRKASLAGLMTRSLWGDGVTPGEYDIMLWSGFDVEKEEEVEKLAQYSKDHKAVEMSFTQVTRGIAQCHIDGLGCQRLDGEPRALLLVLLHLPRPT